MDDVDHNPNNYRVNFFIPVEAKQEIVREILSLVDAFEQSSLYVMKDSQELSNNEGQTILTAGSHTPVNFTPRALDLKTASSIRNNLYKQAEGLRTAKHESIHMTSTDDVDQEGIYYMQRFQGAIVDAFSKICKDKNITVQAGEHSVDLTDAMIAHVETGMNKFTPQSLARTY